METSVVRRNLQLPPVEGNSHSPSTLHGATLGCHPHVMSAPVGGAAVGAVGFSDGQGAVPHTEFHGQGAGGRISNAP